MDWRGVAASGISFAFIKATQNRIDTKYIQNITADRAAGLLAGIYHFLDNSVITPDQARIAVTFLQEIERLTGKRPILYTYPAFIGNFSGLSQYPLWIARYSASRVPEDAQGWNSWEFWQYRGGVDGEGGTLPNGNQRISGIGGPIDLNEYNGTEAELRSKYGKQTVAKPETTPEQKQICVVCETTVKTGHLIGDIIYVAVCDRPSGYVPGYSRL
ncbi:glycoside hydrolase family 25 protein [Paenibacillus sp. WLX2291]|uniref:glycoside hydrolase family 25 protein n=1 Tax=Paenibacillus sp. WLX2291 TaxID=3296934 RepID=UPI00398415E3